MPSRLHLFVGLIFTALATVAVPSVAGAAPGDLTLLYTSGPSIREAPSGRVIGSYGGLNGGWADASPDGARLAMAGAGGTSREPGWLEVFGRDGSCPVEAPGTLGATVGVSWAPDSIRLAVGVQTYTPPLDGIGIVDLGRPGSGPAMIPGAAGGTFPAWRPTPGEDVIAFTTRTADIAVARPAARAVTTLIGGPADDRQPAWSPDGSKLAFIRAAPGGISGSGTVFVADADGSNVHAVGNRSDLFDPHWTRDGARILAARPLMSYTEAQPDAGIWSIDVATGAAEHLVTGISLGSPFDAPVPAQRSGYAVVAANGQAYGFGASCSAPAAAGVGPVVAAVVDPAAPGHWQVDAKGRVRALGSAKHLGDLGGHRPNQPIVAMAATPDGGGYWLVARDGGVFSFGTAAFHGSTGGLRLNQPIVGAAASSDGQGYWLVARDGGIFSFGTAAFRGSTGALRLNQPIVGMRVTPSGRGYWLVARDGGIFSFGDAAFRGSTGALRLNQPIVGMNTSPTGRGYWLVAADGGVFSFGDARYLGSTGSIRLAGPAVTLVVETFPSP